MVVKGIRCCRAFWTPLLWAKKGQDDKNSKKKIQEAISGRMDKSNLFNFFFLISRLLRANDHLPNVFTSFSNLFSIVMCHGP